MRRLVLTVAAAVGAALLSAPVATAEPTWSECSVISTQPMHVAEIPRDELRFGNVSTPVSAMTHLVVQC